MFNSVRAQPRILAFTRTKPHRSLAFARVGLNDPKAHATIASDGTDTTPGHELRVRYFHSTLSYRHSPTNLIFV